MVQRCACIDVGANTTRLLVADVGADGAPREVLVRRATLPLLPGTDGRLPDAAVAALRDVVAWQVAEATRHGTRRLRIVATGSLRAMTERDAVLARLGAPVEVLDGDEEARLAFLGATAGLDLGGTVGVVDAGGASTELAVGTCGGGASWTASVPVGSGVLALAHLRGDPPAPAELEALRRAADAALDGVGAPPAGAVLAVGGPASTVRRLCGERLDAAALEGALALVTAAPVLDVARRTGLQPDKVRLLPGAFALLGAAARALGGVPRVASGGLREGVCVDLALASGHGSRD